LLFLILFAEIKKHEKRERTELWESMFILALLGTVVGAVTALLLSRPNESKMELKVTRDVGS
jgi:Na+/serine symporter